MSRFRTIGVVLLAASVALAAGACSSDSKEATPTSRKALTFGDGPTATSSKVCGVYKIPAMKKIVGAGKDGKQFRVLAPTSIGKKGEAITGETCTWEQLGSNDKVLRLQAEIRNFTAADALTANFDTQRSKAVGPVDVPNLGERAFSTASATNTVLQVQSGTHLLTFVSNADAGFDPIPVSTLQFMAGAALAKIG